MPDAYPDAFHQSLAYYEWLECKREKDEQLDKQLSELSSSVTAAELRISTSRCLFQLEEGSDEDNL